MKNIEMSGLKLLVKIIAFVVFLPSMMMASDSLLVDFQSERHRTEWNWVEYRVTLANISTKTISNPVIQYFAENTNIEYCEKNANKPSCSGMKTGNYGRDSMLRASVDYASNSFKVDTMIVSAGKYTVVNLKTKGKLHPGKSVKLHFRLHREDWKAWDCSRDYSYQKNAAVKEKNYFMAVYDDKNNILWGYNPLDGSNGTGNVVWSSRNKHHVIEKFKGSEDEVVPQGRFWILKDSVFTKSEKDSLKAKGVDVVEVSTYLGRTLLFSRASVPVRVKTLQLQLSGFYNAFSVDDTTSLSLILGGDDLYEKKRVCQEDGSCEEIVEEKLSYRLEVMCWPDVGMFACKDIVTSCGGADALIDRQIVLATVPRDSVQCLSRNHNVKDLATEKVGAPFASCSEDKVYYFSDVDFYNGQIYRSMGLNYLQSSPAWVAGMKETVKTTTWLKGELYTGEGVVVGVYDTGVDFENLAFQEYDVEKKEYFPRKSPWYSKENQKYDYDNTTVGRADHGTRVAGAIGGNGSGAPNSRLRGIAPKVQFYSLGGVFNRQSGHVVNHSTAMVEEDKVCCFVNEKSDPEHHAIYYGKNFRKIDENIFRNWKLFSEGGDFLTKTFVMAAGNNGDVQYYDTMRGFHSILGPFKNAIVVGAIDARAEDIVASFSGLGPTWDGRIKPDIVAHGTRYSFVVATTIGKGRIESYDYDFMCGTSLSAPIVTGVVALMYQKFRERTGLPLEEQSMRNSTTKAILIHSATDMKGKHRVLDGVEIMEGKKVKVSYGQGPDFITGWGSVNAKGALDIIDGYDAANQKFERFREFEIYNGMVKKWTFDVPAGAGVKKVRITLVWDDAVPSVEDVSVENFTKSKLVNDLDMYLVSPSGVRYYPWKLDSLSTAYMDENGKFVGARGLLARTSGYEMITLDEAEKGAYRKKHLECLDSNVFRSCFDHLNNVEVVDVEGESPDANIETGEWQVVVEGYKVKVGNSTDGFAQVVSIVSDFKLEEPVCFEDEHPYLKNKTSSCVHELGDFFENYVTFDNRTYVAPNDWIYLYDGSGQLIGAYTGSELAGKTIGIKTKTLKVVLESNDDNQQGWGYAIDKVEHLSYDVLAPILLDVRRKK